MKSSAYKTGENVVQEEYRGYTIYAHSQIPHPQFMLFTGGAEKLEGDCWGGFQGVEGNSIEEVLGRVRSRLDKGL
jgi:hypothetical protein